jgi:hypothetical protein
MFTNVRSDDGRFPTIPALKAIQGTSEFGSTFIPQFLGTASGL